MHHTYMITYDLCRCDVGRHSLIATTMGGVSIGTEEAEA